MQNVGNIDRTTYLGSSDCAAILGISPWDTKLKVYYEKIGALSTAENSAAQEKIFRRGKLLEPVVLQMLQDECDWVNIVRRGQRYRHPNYDFIAAEIDAEHEDNGQIINIEAKSVGNKWAAKDWGKSGDADNIPNYYIAQIMHALWVTGRQKCLAAAWVGGLDDFRYYTIERNEELISIIAKAELDFWHNHILTKTPPAPSTLGDINNYFNHSNGLTCEVNKETLSLIEQYRAAKENEGQAKKIADNLKAQLACELKENEGFTYGDKLILSFKSHSMNRLDNAALKEAHPDIYQEFCKQSTGRKMLIHKF